MSPALINLWNKELRAVVEAPEMRQRLIGLGLDRFDLATLQLAERRFNLLPNRRTRADRPEHLPKQYLEILCRGHSSHGEHGLRPKPARPEGLLDGLR